MIYDFHTHTFLSDGSLSPIELIRRATVNGYAAIGITDHAGLGGLEQMLPVLVRDCALAERYWGIIALPGVELTHLPPEAIPDAARQAKELGARLVAVHGETVVEPVPPGTNRAAIACADVDVLAHPGLLTLDEAREAAANATFLEISGRKGHAFANGHVVRVALEAGASLLLDSDAHDPPDLLTAELARIIVLGSGLGVDLVGEVLEENPRRLLRAVMAGRRSA